MAEGRVLVNVAQHLQDDGAQEGVTRHGSDAPLDIFATGQGAQLGVDTDAFVLLAGAVIPMRQDELILSAKAVLEDIIRLELGQAVVKSYSYKLWLADSTLTHAANRSAPMPTPEGAVSPFCFYRDLTSGQTRVWYRTPLLGPIMSYVDTPTFSWVITSEKKTISGYETQLATCQFRGRSYEAWFAPSIPISAGPALFCGLPGLILELRTTDGEHHFLLDALQKRSADIVEWKVRLAKVVSRPQFRDYYQRLHKHPMQTFKSNGQQVHPMNAQGDYASEAEAMAWQLPFNPIELE